MNWRKLLLSDAPPAVILIRLLVGGVFLSEGLQKFLYAETLGNSQELPLHIQVSSDLNRAEIVER